MSPDATRGRGYRMVLLSVPADGVIGGEFGKQVRFQFLSRGGG
jgi:hypothetical protein